MKKILAILLTICTLVLCLVSCNDTDANTPPNDVVPVEHGNVDGKCLACDLCYFDILRNIVLENGTQSQYYHENKVIELIVDDHYIFSASEKDSDMLTIKYYQHASDLMNRSYQYLFIEFNRANVKYGEYNWSYNTDRYSFLSGKTIRGTLVAEDFKEITNTLPYTKDDNVTNADSYAVIVTSHFKKVITEGIPKVLEYGDYNKTAKHFGFKYFD